VNHGRFHFELEPSASSSEKLRRMRSRISKRREIPPMMTVTKSQIRCRIGGREMQPMPLGPSSVIG